MWSSERAAGPCTSWDSWEWLDLLYWWPLLLPCWYAHNIYLPKWLSVSFGVINHSDSHPCDPKVYNIFNLTALFPISLTGEIWLDVLHKHHSYLWVCGLLWDWTWPHPMVHCGWTVQSRPKTLGFCCSWILQLDRKLYCGHVLSVCRGKRPMGIIRRILAHLFRLVWLTFFSLSSTLTGALWAVRVYHLHHIFTWLLRLHLLQSPRNQGPDIRWNLRWFPTDSVSGWEALARRAQQPGGGLSTLNLSSDPAFFICSHFCTYLLRKRGHQAIYQTFPLFLWLHSPLSPPETPRWTRDMGFERQGVGVVIIFLLSERWLF